ncbi:DUF4238 domain-containing protein [Actinomadura meyerae]|uniref:DUF4238 domain-containing protein n=1 Tax=Actinomadura meyerae TaxID=240840 RepID=UPI000B784EAE|nr:DUF4238 domain-containing protein [Actinomadura meyerae]
MLASADTFKVDRHLHLSNIVDMFEGSINLVFFRQPWVLATFQRKALGTSDTPLVLIPDPMNREMGLGTGLGTAMQLFIPLSRRVGLCMGGLGDKAEDGFLPGTTAIAKQLNSYTLHNARKAVFHHPHDAPFAGMRIPEPRTEEMRIPHKQINNLIAGFARQQGRLPEDP